jgi:hypothetical protein
MADQLQLRGGSTAQTAAFTGALREVTVDTDKKTVVVHDGTTAGGNPLLRQDLSNLPAGTIDNADINASAGIVDTKLATIATAGKVSNSATTATSNNTASAIIARDASGNFDATSINGGPLAGTRNRIINGNFDFWQRGTSFTASDYGADRWIHARFGTTHTATRQAFTLGQTAVPGEPTYFCRTVVSSVAGAGNYAVLVQRIEDVRTFAGQQVTVSFWAKADATKNIAINMVQIFGTGGSPSANVGISGTKISVGTTFQKVTVTATLPSISGKTLGTNNNSTLNLNIWFDAGSTWNTTPTPSASNPAPSRLPKCKSNPALSPPRLNGAATGRSWRCVRGITSSWETDALVMLDHPLRLSSWRSSHLPMRTAPTASWNTGKNARFRYQTIDMVNGGSTSLANTISTAEGIWSQQSGYAGLTLYLPVFSRNNANDSLFIQCSAEL